MKPSNEFVFPDVNGIRIIGVGGILEYNVEAKNFSGLSSYTDKLIISAGQLH